MSYKESRYRCTKWRNTKVCKWPGGISRVDIATNTSNPTCIGYFQTMYLIHNSACVSTLKFDTALTMCEYDKSSLQTNQYKGQNTTLDLSICMLTQRKHTTLMCDIYYVLVQPELERTQKFSSVYYVLHAMVRMTCCSPSCLPCPGKLHIKQSTLSGV